MICSAPERTAACRAGSQPSASSSVVPTTGITVYGCGPDETLLFHHLASRLGVRLTMTATAVSERNADLAQGNRCVSVGHKTRVDKGTLLALSRAGVEYVSTRSIGHDHIDVEYAAQLGITVGNVSYSPDSVADYTLMLMLMAVRHVRSVIQRADAHDYRLGERGRELQDLTVGVIGTGRIGSAVVRRLRGFGCSVLASDPRPSAVIDHVPLDDLLRRSDIVTLHVPLTPDTHHLLDRRRIQQMKPGAYVVNTARGPVLDTEALVVALESGRLGGAALDVLEGEEGIFYADCRERPPMESEVLHRLRRLPNVLITPHTAYYTDRALSDAVEHSLLSCLDFERGNAS